MLKQGYERGSCLVYNNGRQIPACQATLKQNDGLWYRLVRSVHLSRPEHYLSIYQSGCNHTCKKCHSADFSQKACGNWLSTHQIANLAKEYEKQVTVWEPRDKATMWHATDICRACGACILYGRKSNLCPGVLNERYISLSPQGFGPARNIVAFTGGDIACQAQFYAQATFKIKQLCKNIWVLLETNGFGLTEENLDLLKDSGLDSFWLDIKAFDEKIYKSLCGTSNKTVLEAPLHIKERGFTLEVLTLFIPSLIEKAEINNIARLIHSFDSSTPFTILAFFPAYKLNHLSSPTLSQMIDVFQSVKEIGLKRVKLGNCSVFAKTDEDWEKLIKEVGKHGIG